MTESAQKITLHYFALLREQRGLDREQIETDAVTPRALYERLAAAHGFTLPAARIGVAINDSFAALDQVLRDGDSVVFIPPVAGG